MGAWEREAIIELPVSTSVRQVVPKVCAIYTHGLTCKIMCVYSVFNVCHVYSVYSVYRVFGVGVYRGVYRS